MTYQNPSEGGLHLILSKKGLNRNRTFAKEIGSLGLSEGRYFFERLNRDESICRQKDQTMTLDDYLLLITKSALVVFQTRPSDPFPIISLAITNVYRPGDKVNNLLLWYWCKYTDENLTKVKQLFEKTYRRDFPSI